MSQLQGVEGKLLQFNYKRKAHGYQSLIMIWDGTSDLEIGTKRVSVNQIGMMKQPKSFNSVAGLVQPLEASTIGCFDNTIPSKEVLDVWRNAKVVYFDVDNTVCLNEGIDELAEFCGVGKAVVEGTASLTFLFSLVFAKEINGSMPFEEALAARLSLFNLSLAQVQDFLEKRSPRCGNCTFLSEAHRTSWLRDNGTNVYLVFSGFRQMINVFILLKPVAFILGIPLENIFANKLLFGALESFWGLIQMSQLQGVEKKLLHIVDDQSIWCLF
ncbi:unnamed protein product [Ilex paraguariensis]|uniref:phosphoserine phosphatase n=1 Tax=Ilex paraguariensis TaxID=185542 RepID=A0ABC8RTL5_9AQUA